MPAIQPSLLKTQTIDLIDHFSRPADFLHNLHDLLEFYADRTHRPNTVTNAVHLLQEHRVPKPVLRSIEQILIPKIISNPQGALILADALWQDHWAEGRLFAIFILGQLPPKPANLILDRIAAWGSTCKELSIVQAIATRGTESLRLQAETEYFQSLEKWLTYKQHPLRRISLYAINALINTENFENLPLLFRWLGPLIRNAEIEFKDQLSDILRAMAKKAPQETSHFLRQIIVSAPNVQTAAIIRHALDAFPPDLQNLLRNYLRRYKNKKAPLGS
ncbi:MAG: DNA alkylation repair protein [Chloroflexi bacterium]|nr:DNA alkylation repair protein [Chloroflexota bacterium]